MRTQWHRGEQWLRSRSVSGCISGRAESWDSKVIFTLIVNGALLPVANRVLHVPFTSSLDTPALLPNSTQSVQHGQMGHLLPHPAQPISRSLEYIYIQLTWLNHPISRLDRCLYCHCRITTSPYAHFVCCLRFLCYCHDSSPL